MVVVVWTDLFVNVENILLVMLCVVEEWTAGLFFSVKTAARKLESTDESGLGLVSHSEPSSGMDGWLRDLLECFR